MLHTRTSNESGSAVAAAKAPVAGDVGRRVLEDVASTRRRFAAERAIDDVLQDSFPASDPPSWNPGVARPGASVREPVARAATIEVRKRTFLQALVSFAGAAAIVLTVPFMILLIGLPLALAVRGLLEVIAWVFGIAVH